MAARGPVAAWQLPALERAKRTLSSLAGGAARNHAQTFSRVLRSRSRTVAIAAKRNRLSINPSDFVELGSCQRATTTPLAEAVEKIMQRVVVECLVVRALAVERVRVRAGGSTRLDLAKPLVDEF